MARVLSGGATRSVVGIRGLCKRVIHTTRCSNENCNGTSTSILIPTDQDPVVKLHPRSKREMVCIPWRCNCGRSGFRYFSLDTLSETELEKLRKEKRSKKLQCVKRRNGKQRHNNGLKT